MSIKIDAPNQAYTFNGLAGNGSGFVTVNNSGVLGFSTGTGAPVYPSTQIPFGDGVTAGGTTSANLAYDGFHLNLDDGLANSFINAGQQGTTVGAGNVGVGTTGGEAGALLTGGASNTYIGTGAGAGNVNGNNQTAVGASALGGAQGDLNTAIGSAAGLLVTNGAEGTYIGWNTGVTAGTENYSIAIGAKSKITADNQLVIGSADSLRYISDGYFGNGVQVDSGATPHDFTFHTAGANVADTDTAGANMLFQSGLATGNAVSGYFSWLTGDAGATGTTPQTPTEKMRLLKTGALQFNKYGTGAFAGSATFNLAVDGSGNVVETGSSAPVSLTYAAATTLIGNIIAGQQYLINDRADLGIMVFGLDANRYSLQASGGFLNPDFQNIGNDVSANPNYAGVNGVTGFNPSFVRGVWYVGGESGTFGLHDIVFWDGLHYFVQDDLNFNGTNPATNAAAYTLLPKAISNVGYVEEWDFILYAFEDDFLALRADYRENWIYAVSTTSIVDDFQWGNDNVRYNWTDSVSTIVNINQRGFCKANHVIAKSKLTVTNDNEGGVNNNVLQNKADVEVFKDFSIALDGCSFSNIIIGAGAIDSSAPHINLRCQQGFSNFEAVIDVTGLTTLDITADNNYCGIINITGSASETINKIQHTPTLFSVTILPENGLSLEVDFTTVGSAGQDDIVLETPANITLVGRADSDLSDFLIIQNKNGVTNRQIGGSIITP